MFRLLFLGNVNDCVEIWYALGNPLATAYAVVTDGVSLPCARAHRALYPTNGSAGYVQIWWVGFESSKVLSASHGLGSLHVRTCRAHFCISGTA